MLKRIICFFKGHTEPEPHLTETKHSIHTERCKRCHSTLGWGFRKWYDMPPPNSTEKQMQDWKEYMNERAQQLRDGVEYNKKQV